MNPLIKRLEDVLGLTPYEARIYFAISTLFDQANISELARATKIPRTALYVSIKSLLDKGLLSTFTLGKRKYYKAFPAKDLETVFDRKKADLSFIIKSLSSVLPTNTDSEPFDIKYFPGSNGAHRAADIFLNGTNGKLWKTFEGGVFNEYFLELHQFQDYISRRVAKGIKAEMILSVDVAYPWLKERLENDKKELRETVIFPEKNLPLPLSIAVNEHSVLIVSAKETVFGVVINSSPLARTLWSIHDMIWKRYKISD